MRRQPVNLTCIEKLGDPSRADDFAVRQGFEEINGSFYAGRNARLFRDFYIVKCEVHR